MVLWILWMLGIVLCPANEEKSCGGSTNAQRKHECGNKKPPSDCCARVSVDGFQYRFVQTEDTSQFDCVTNCIYERPDLVDSPYFCFAHGEQDILCEDAQRGCETTVFNSVSTLATSWEEGQTTLSVKDGGISFKCQIKFSFSLKKGIKFNEILFCCSRSDDEGQDAIETLGKHSFEISSNDGILLDCSLGVAFIMGILSDDILRKTLKCSISEDNGCVTNQGEIFPHTCQFPFIYKGRKFHGCTDVDTKQENRLWCPTKINEKEEMVDGEWGYCNSKCNFCAGSKILEESRKRKPLSVQRPCGFDCLINPKKTMEGSDKAPLSPPNVKMLKKKTNYIGKKSEQYTFFVGAQEVSLSCPDTKFYHPLLARMSNVVALCGPEQNRFTVKSQDGDVLTKKLKNTQLGCDPCPPYSKYIAGYVSTKDLENSEVHLKIKTIGECFKICIKSCTCRTIYYSKKTKRCEIISKDVEKTEKGKKEDFLICAISSAAHGVECITERETITEVTNQPVAGDSCCDSYKVDSTGDIRMIQPSTVGVYMREGTRHGKPLYKKGNNLLYFSKHKTWIVSTSLSSTALIETKNIPTSQCPNDPVLWRFQSKKNKNWEVDRNTKVTCSDFCGVDISVDRDRYLADLNAEFIFSLLKTKNLQMFKVAEFEKETKITNHKQMYRKDPGLYSLVLAPSTAKCEPKMFQDAARNKNRYFPVFVGKNIPNDVLRIFEAKAKDLKSFYPGERLQLCGTYQPISSQELQSTLKILTSVFKFTLNDKSLALSKNRLKHCSSALESAKSLGKTSLTFQKSDEEERCKLLLDLVKNNYKYKDYITCSAKDSCRYRTGCKCNYHADCTDPDNPSCNSNSCGKIATCSNQNLAKICQRPAFGYKLVCKGNNTQGSCVECTTNSHCTTLGFTPGWGCNNAEAECHRCTLAKCQTTGKICLGEKTCGPVPLTKYVGIKAERNGLFNLLAEYAKICFKDIEGNKNKAFFQAFHKTTTVAKQIKDLTQKKPDNPEHDMCKKFAALGTGKPGPDHSEQILLPKMEEIAKDNVNSPMTFYLFTFNSPCYSCRIKILSTVKTYMKHEWVVGFQRWYSDAPKDPKNPKVSTCSERYEKWCKGLNEQKATISETNLKFVWFNPQNERVDSKTDESCTTVRDSIVSKLANC